MIDVFFTKKDNRPLTIGITYKRKKCSNQISFQKTSSIHFEQNFYIVHIAYTQLSID